MLRPLLARAWFARTTLAVLIGLIIQVVSLAPGRCRIPGVR